MLKRSAIKERIDEGSLRVVPLIDDLSSKPGNATLDVHLGRWFLTLRHSTHAALDLTELPSEESFGFVPTERDLSDLKFVDFDKHFVLHPNRFVLGVTLEWFNLGDELTGSIVGKSFLGRHGLIIETAPIVHPNFVGSLTLELANVGEVPVKLLPGMEIAQLQLSETTGEGEGGGRLLGSRRPTLGSRRSDATVRNIRQKIRPKEANPIT